MLPRELSNEDRMTINESSKYLRMVRKRYTKAGSTDRGQLLDEIESITGLHRRSLIRQMDLPTSCASGCVPYTLPENR